jgi:hypothetical protein
MEQRPVTWERETRTFYYGLRIPISDTMDLFVPKARKGKKGDSKPSCVVDLKDLLVSGIEGRVTL